MIERGYTFCIRDRITGAICIYGDILDWDANGIEISVENGGWYGYIGLDGVLSIENNKGQHDLANGLFEIQFDPLPRHVEPGDTIDGQIPC